MPYALSRQARHDIERLAVDVARDKGQASADKMLERLRVTFEMIGAHPSVGRDRSLDLGPGRRSSVSGRNIVIHRGFGRTVLIERVIDGRRDYPALLQS